jgi:hypothetical protein
MPQIRRINTMGVAREDDAAKGTSVAVSTGMFFGIDSGMLKSMVEYEDIAPAIGQMMYGQEKHVTKKWSEISFSGPVKTDWIGHFLTGILGSVSSANSSGETVVRDHTITLINTNVLPAYTMYMLDGVQSDKATYCTVKKVTLTCEAGKAMRADVEMVGQARENGTGTKAFSTDHHFQSSMGSVKLETAITNLAGGTALEIINMKVEMSRDVTPIFKQGSVEPFAFVSGPLKVTGELTLLWTAATYRTLYEAGTDKALLISYNDAATTIGSAETPSMDITIAKVYITKHERPDGIDEPDIEKLSFEATYDLDEADTNKDIKIVLVNEEATTAYTEPA